MQHLIAIAAGGSLGALCRHGVNVVCLRGLALPSAWGTLTVNVVGSLLLGLFAASPWGQHQLTQGVVAIGFLGALTTFSTFSLETVRLLQSDASALALLNAAANLALGLAALAGGLSLGRGLFAA